MTLHPLAFSASARAQPRWRPVLVAICALASGAGACAEPGDDGVAAVRAALGEPMGDYPAYEERVALYATNRARVSPTTEGWPSYPPQPPLQWNYDLNRSSRAHSLDMRDTPCFQHPSCDGTDTFTRVLTYYTGPWTMLAENIAAGVLDPQTVVHNWINEIGSTPGETGHRDAIFSAVLTLLGVGFAPGGTTQTPNYWTQDFVATSIKLPRLSDGIHFPQTAATGGQITFAATYYDAAVGAAEPQVFAVVDGSCASLPRLRGTTGLGAYEAPLGLADGCHPYYFVATGGDGTAVDAYPEAGSLQVGVGAAGSACALFVATRIAATCTAGPDGGAGMGAGAGGPAGAGGATGAEASGAAGVEASGAGGRTVGETGAGGPDGGASTMMGTGGAPQPGGGAAEALGIHCSVSGGPSPVALAPAVLCVVLAWARRSRRRRLP